MVGDLLLFFGPNGFGKTSLAEALEWLLYGTTKRRQRGDGYSRSEYAGSFGNIHGKKPVEVTATVSVGGADIVLSRRITIGEESETLVDGIVASFAKVGISPIEAVYPVVAQHGLQTFIHSKPKDRRDTICAALGLDEITSLKTSLDGARTSFQRSPPAAVSNARRDLLTNTQALASIPATAAMVGRWLKNPLQLNVADDTAALLTAAEALTGKVCTNFPLALVALREKRALAGKAVFDVEKLRPDDDAPALLSSFAPHISDFNERADTVERAAAAAIASMASSYAAAVLEFWQKGLELAPSGDTCPMCEAPTLDQARRDELLRRIASSSATLASFRTLTEAIVAAKGGLGAIRTAVVGIGAINLEAADKAHLRQLFSDQPNDVEAFMRLYDAVVADRSSVLEQITATLAFLAGCVERLADATHSPTVLAQAGNMKVALTPLINTLQTTVRRYLDGWPEFERLLEGRIASNDLVARIDAVGKTIANGAKMSLLAKYDQVLSESQELIRTVEQAIKKKQNALLTTRGGEVKDLYGRLNKGADVGFEGMEPGTDSMKLHATSFGVRMSAAANLSECQLNCVGLSMWLMRATTPSSPFGFVLLDDPVQSMDDTHAEAFMSDIVPFLLDKHQKQVIVLSHVQHITDRLRTINQHRSMRLYHFDNYDQSGPTITEQVKLKMLLSEIQSAAKGNESNRAYAVDRLRVLAEYFIREVHLKILLKPAPPTYDSATAAGLLPLFRTITNTTQQEHQGLSDTVNFCNPSHHTQVGYSVPLASNIQPHIDRLSTLITKYQL
jgi:energy-coupling factor transporter ATP-binding protein EcfA2